MLARTVPTKSVWTCISSKSISDFERRQEWQPCTYIQASSYEAVAAVERLQPDIVVMDIRMPGLDGIAAAREIRAKYPHVKIIGLSEYAYGYNTDAMEKAGALGVYQKSSALEELYPAIKKFTAIQPTI